MSVSARSAFTHPFSELLFEVIHLPFPEKGKEEQTAAALRSKIEEQGGAIAAFIFEPLVLGAGGMLMYEAAILDELITLCRNNNILIIADEVMTGFGRTGKLFASEYLRNDPDIICLSKGITGGTMPLGVTSCNEEIFRAFLSSDRSKTFFHGHSYTANPVACAASLASYDLLMEDDCRRRIQRIGDKHLQFIEKNAGNPVVKNLRSTGTILAMDVETSEQNSYFHSLRDRMYHFFLKKGVILRPLGNTVYLMPPYCISDEDLDYVYEVIVAGAGSGWPEDGK